MKKHLKVIGMMVVGGLAGAIGLPLLYLMAHLTFLWAGYQANAPFSEMRPIIIFDIFAGVAVGAWLGMPTGVIAFSHKQDPKEAGRTCIMVGVVTSLVLMFWVASASKIVLAGNSARLIGGSIILLPIVGFPVLWIILLFVWGFRLLRYSRSLG